MRFFNYLILLCVIGVPLPVWSQVSFCCPAIDDDNWQHATIADGIYWQFAAFDDIFDAPQYLNLVRLSTEMAAAKFRLAAADSVQPGSSRLHPAEFAADYNSAVIINAGFFSDHQANVNSGIFKWDGVVYPFLKEETDELHFVGSSAVGLDSEGNWLFYDRQGKIWPDDWPEAMHAVAGGHRLVRNSRVTEQIRTENYTTAREVRHAGRRHPRTSICLTDDHSVLMLVADGRHDEAAGFTLLELANLLKSFGCAQALNLDGGGSSSMYIDGHGVVNHPSDNGIFDREGDRAIRTVIILETES